MALGPHGSTSNLHTAALPSPPIYLATWTWLRLPFLSAVLGQLSPPLQGMAEVWVGCTQAAGSSYTETQVNSLMPQGGYQRLVLNWSTAFRNFVIKLVISKKG